MSTSKAGKASAPKSHACDTCGGTGGDLEVMLSRERSGGTSRARFQLGSPGENALAILDHSWKNNMIVLTVDGRCQVCDGEGRISDVMPVSDSIADAETWRAWVRSLPIIGKRVKMLRLAANFQTAAYVARSGAGLTDASGSWTPLQAAGYARSAARAVFAAVPGLRA